MSAVPETATCVGRERELASIGVQLEATDQHRAGICVVRGATGSGKTTLLRGFADSLDIEDQRVVAWGRCDRQTGPGRPLLPWAGILETLAGTGEVATPHIPIKEETRLTSARTAFTDLAPDLLELIVPGVGLVIRSAKLLSQKTSLTRRLTSRRLGQERAAVDADRARLEEQYIAIVERVLDDSPLILIIDDLQYADTASLELLTRLAKKVAHRQVLLVVAFQDQTADSSLRKSLEVVADILPSTTIDLDLAMHSHGAELVEAYVDAVVPGVRRRFIRDVTRHTGGHPLFLVELIRHLKHQQQLVQVDDEWRDEEHISWTEMPRKVENLLTSQLNALDQEVRDVLQAASIEGDQFTVEVIAGVLDKTPRSVARLLARSVPSNLIEPLGQFYLGETRTSRFRFRHTLARHHTYQSVPAVERIYLHEAIGTEYERLGGDTTGALAAQLAYHFDEAGVKGAARRYYLLAAEHAGSAGSLNEATLQLDKALELCESQTADEVTVCMRLSKVQCTIGNFETARTLIDRATSTAESLEADGLAEVLVQKSIVQCRQSEFDAAYDAASKAAELASAANDQLLLTQALSALSFVCAKRGNFNQALDYEDEALSIAERLKEADLIAGCLLHRGWCLKELGRYDDALLPLQQSLEIQTRDRPNYSILAGTHNALADLHISMELYPQAREHLSEAVGCWRKFDQHADVVVGLNNLANLANREGLYDQALDYGRQAYAADIAVLGPAHPDLAFSLTCLGESHIGLSNFKEAIDVLQQANQLRESNKVPAGNVAWTRWLLGRCLVDGGQDTQVGMNMVAHAHDVFQEMGAAAQSELKDVQTWMNARDRLT